MKILLKFTEIVQRNLILFLLLILRNLPIKNLLKTLMGLYKNDYQRTDQNFKQ